MERCSWTSLDTLLEQRRSIRRYTGQMPGDNAIEQVVRAAFTAPSPSNSQPVRIYRIESADIRRKLEAHMVRGRERFLAELAAKPGSKRVNNWVNAYWRYCEFMFHAPVLLAVGSIQHLEGFSRRMVEAGLIHEDTTEQRDLAVTVGLSLSAMLLKATALNLGTCVLTAPLTFFPDPERVLGLNQIRIHCYLTLGHADENPEAPRKKPFDQMYFRI
jgi:nitroreductase